MPTRLFGALTAQAGISHPYHAPAAPPLARLRLAPYDTPPMATRFGIGYDAHRLVEGVPLTLGGERVPSDHGLAGHSDGDAAAHAVIDALLGAAALGDVGSRFPEDDPAVPRGVSSVVLLERTAVLLREAGWRVVNVDATIVLQRPRIAERLSAMRANLAAAVGAPPSAVSVKATTEDGLGFTGAGEGASAIAVASITDDPE